MEISFRTKNRILIISNILFFVAYWALVIVLYQHLPGQIPIHFDIAGNATRMEDATPGNWLLSPLIITMSSLTAAMLVWAFTTLGIENYNFPQKKEVLKLSQDSQGPFLRVVKEFLWFSILGALLYMFAIGMVVSLHVYLYAVDVAPIPVFWWVVLATVAYTGWLTIEYFRIKKAFKKELSRVSRTTQRDNQPIY